MTGDHQLGASSPPTDGRSVGPPPCRSVSVSDPPVENIVIVGSDGGGLGAALAWASVSADMHLGIQDVWFVA